MNIDAFAAAHGLRNDPVVGATALYRGSPYLTLCSHGIKPQGEEAKKYESEEKAWASYWEQLAAYVGERRKGVLHWRRQPVLIEDMPHGFFVVSRVLLTNE